MNFDQLRAKYQGYSDDEILRGLQATQYPDYGIDEIKAALGYKPRTRNVAAVANDLVIEAANAAAGGVSAVGNFIKPGNRVSEFIDKNLVEPGEASQSDFAKDAKARMRERIANADGVTDELAAVGGYITDAPGLAAAQAVGSFVGPGVAVKGGSLMARALGASQRGAARGGMAGGAVAGGSMAGGDAANTAYDLVIQAGGTEAEAEAAARQASAIPAAVGAVGGVFGAERLFAGAAGPAGGAIRRAAVTGLSEAAQEGVEEGVTQFEGQRAAQAFDPSIDPTKGVAAAAGLGAALGGITGAGVSLITPEQQRADATRRLSSAQSVDEAIAAANDLASPPESLMAQARGFTAQREAQALSSIEQQGAADVKGLRQFGVGTPLPKVTPREPAKATAEIVPDAPLFDRLLTAKEQLADPGVREAIRGKLGDELLSDALYYAAQAEAPGSVPDVTRERMLGVAEAIISRATMQAIERSRPVGSLGMQRADAPRRLETTPPAPRLGLDTAPTGTVLVDRAGTAVPETRADAINTRQRVDRMRNRTRTGMEGQTLRDRVYGAAPGVMVGEGTLTTPQRKTPATPLLEAPVASNVAAIDAAAREAATSPTNDRPEPSDAQKEAGNYKVGRARIDGMDVSIENPKGSVRKSKADAPQPWEVTMPAHYGYIRGTQGADGDHVDLFIGDRGDNGRYWVINQNKPDGTGFDEHKVVTGVDSAEEAVSIYKKSFADGFGEKVFKSITSEYDAAGLKTLLPSLKKAKAVPAMASAVPASAQTESRSQSDQERPEAAAGEAPQPQAQAPVAPATVPAAPQGQTTRAASGDGTPSLRERVERARKKPGSAAPRSSAAPTTKESTDGQERLQDGRRQEEVAAVKESQAAAGGGPAAADRSASEWADEMARLRARKPRPLEKRYGPNPTPAQTEQHNAEMRVWNAEYRKASAAQKKALERDNAAVRDRRTMQEKVERPAKPDEVVATAGDANADGERKFYVTMVRGDRVARLAGPFDTKAEAEGMVDRARAAANEADPRSAFDAFGVSAITSKEHKPGTLNKALGIGQDEPSKETPAKPAAASKQSSPPAPASPRSTQAAPAAPVSRFDGFKAAMAKLYDGELSIDDYRAAYRSVRDGAAEARAELNKLTKDELIRTFGIMRDGKKDELVGIAYDSMVDRFALGKSYGPNSYGMTRGGYENYLRLKAEALDALVEGQTEDDLATFAKEVAARREEAAQRRAAHAQAIADPKTIPEFRAYLEHHMREGKTNREARMSLTPEQRALMDSLWAKETRSSRKGKQDEQRTTVRVAGQTVDGQIIATKHTKKGHDLFVVRLAERVEREDYDTLNAGAKKIGGYYSSYRGGGAIAGFQFTTREQAEAFVKLAGGDASDATAAAQERRDAFADDRSQTAVQRLTEMADALEERADESLGRERKANTERRARMAASAEAEAQSQKALARTMRNIASAIDAGKVEFLDRVRQKVQVEMLAGMVRRAHDDQLRAKYPSYSDFEKHKGEAPTTEAADFAEFPSYTAYRSDLAGLGRQLLEVDGTKLLGQRLMKVADDVSDAYLAFAKEPGNLFKLSAFGVRRGEEMRTAIFPDKATAERSLSRSGLAGHGIVFQEKRGVNRIILSPSEAIKRGIWKGDGDKRITLTEDFGAELVAKIGKAARRGAKVSVPWQFETAHDRLKALARMGIETPAEMRAALREFIGLREQAAAPDKVKQLERAMVGKKNDGFDFFPTPEGVADEMVEVAGLEPGMRVLEPSAGMGHIAERIRAAGVEPDVGEIASDRRELLEAKGFNLVARDFMEFTDADHATRGFTYGDVFRAKDGTLGILRGSGGMGSDRVGLDPLDENGKADPRRSRWESFSDLEPVEKRNVGSGYDRILMNPPFSDGRDIAHVRHAYELLKPGGRLVAIMGEGAFSQSFKRAEEFRDWLESVGGTEEKLPEGTFLDPSLPVNTGANARMVVIEKGEERLSIADADERTGLTVDGVQRAADDIAKDLDDAPTVVVVQDMREAKLTAGAAKERVSLGESGDERGFLHDGTLYLIADELPTRGAVAEAIQEGVRRSQRGKFGEPLDLDALSVAEDDGARDTPTRGTASPRHQQLVAELARRLSARAGRAVVFDAVAQGRGEDAGRGRELAAVSTVARRLFGHEVVPVRFDGAPLFNGAMATWAPGVIFVNADATRPMMAVIGHELLHQLKNESKALYEVLDSRLAKVLREPGRYRDALAAKYEKQGLKPTDSWMEELHADIVGDFFTEAQFWQDMAADQPGLFKKVAMAIKRFLDSAIDKVWATRPFGTEQYITDLEAARAAVVEAMRQYGGSQVGAMTSQSDGINLSVADTIRTSQDLVDAKGGVFDFNRLGTTGQDRVRTAMDGSRPFWLGLLTRDQIADVYGKEIESVKDYDNLTRAMENERQKMAGEADELYTDWAKLPAEVNDKLARIMLEATVHQVHPDGDYDGANAERKAVHARISTAYKLLPKDAQAMYRRVKAYHADTLSKLVRAVEGRIQRQVKDGKARAAALTNIRKMFDKYLEDGPYFPLSRFGDFLVIATRGDKDRVVATYETAGEQQAAARELEKEGFTVKLKTTKTYSRELDGSAGKFIGDVLSTVDSLDFNEASVGGKTADLKAKMLDDLNQLFIRALPDLSYRKHFLHRKNTPGFSGDVMRGFASSAFHAASHIARLNHGDKMTFALQDAYDQIERADAGDFNLHSQVLNELSKRHDAALNPNTHPIAAMLSQVGFVMYLGLSPAAGLVNALQTVMVTMPHLGARYGFGKTNAAMASAYKDILSAKPNAKNGWNAAQSPKLSSAERAAMSKLQDEGVIDLTQAHDLAAATGIDTGNVARSKAAFAMARAMKIVGWTFHIPEVMNRQVTALSAYRLEMERSDDQAKAMDAAREAIKRTQFDYSASNRARFMQGNVARVVTQFKQYSQNMTYLLGRAAHQALLGEDPEVRAIARKQLVATMGVTFAMAGALGLPGIGAVMGLIGMMVGAMDDDDKPWDWKVEFRNLAADAFGKEAGEVLSKGLPRALMPWDISNRVSLSDLWWRDNGREGMNPREAFANDMQNILGPSAGTLLGLYTAADHMARGNWSKAVESMVPKALRDPLKGVREASEGVTTYTGEPLMDTTATENIGRMLGFAPARASEMFEARNAVKNAETAITEKRQRLLSTIVKARMDRDTETAREIQAEIAEFNRRNPAFRITSETITKSQVAKMKARAQTRDGIRLAPKRDELRALGRFAEVD